MDNKYENNKTIIIYFSGTGNNLFVTKRLGELLGTKRIYPFRALVNKEKPISLEGYKNIIFSAPSYYSHIPPFVKQVLNKVCLNINQNIYSIVVCGGNRGHAVEDLRECIHNADGKVRGEYSLMLPGSYILSYGAFPKWVINFENFLAKRKVEKIADDIRNGRGKLLKRTGIFYKESSEPRLQEAILNFKTVGASYDVSDSCIGCGCCQKVCPVSNITIIDGKPVFGQECQQCMACIQWCPMRAIDYKQIASKRKNYHHPEILVTDMITGNTKL